MTVVSRLRRYRHQAKGKNDKALRLRPKELVEERHRFGCPRLHVMLKRESVVINHKRTERIYRKERLSLLKENLLKFTAQCYLCGQPAHGLDK